MKQDENKMETKWKQNKNTFSTIKDKHHQIIMLSKYSATNSEHHHTQAPSNNNAIKIMTSQKQAAHQASTEAKQYQKQASTKLNDSEAKQYQKQASDLIKNGVVMVIL